MIEQSVRRMGLSLASMPSSIWPKVGCVLSVAAPLASLVGSLWITITALAVYVGFCALFAIRCLAINGTIPKPSDAPQST